MPKFADLSLWDGIDNLTPADTLTPAEACSALATAPPAGPPTHCAWLYLCRPDGDGWSVIRLPLLQASAIEADAALTEACERMQATFPRAVLTGEVLPAGQAPTGHGEILRQVHTTAWGG